MENIEPPPPLYNGSSPEEVLSKPPISLVSYSKKFHFLPCVKDGQGNASAVLRLESIIITIILSYHGGAVASLIISEILPPLLVIGYVPQAPQSDVGWVELRVPAGVVVVYETGTLMVILEWSAFEAVKFLAGVLGETELSANIVWFQVVELLYIVRITSKFSYVSRVS